VPYDQLLGLYLAADVYVSFSRWEGYNVGMAQALALGLPVVASDIEGHRELAVFTNNHVMPINEELGRLVRAHQERGCIVERTPKITRWEESSRLFEEAIAALMG